MIYSQEDRHRERFTVREIRKHKQVFGEIQKGKCRTVRERYKWVDRNKRRMERYSQEREEQRQMQVGR